jgi:hypothetical protein
MPEPPGTRVFSREICTTNFSQCFRQPTSINKYTGETNPRVWLNDYRLAYQLGGATTDEVIIRNLPLHLANSVRTWLEHLPPSQIHNWDDLVRTFVRNTYVHPGNFWDLRACTQKPSESLQDFIRCFSKHCTELPSVAQSEIVHAFLDGTTCRDLMRELGQNLLVESNELFDIATSFAFDEEAVGSIFDGKKGKRVDDAPTMNVIDLPVWFGTPDKFRKETLTFEVVGFRGAYHVILGRPCYAKFMAVPNYTYLKMNMPRPKGIITVGSSIGHAFECDVECVEQVEALALDEALMANMEKLVNEDLDSTAKHAGTFEAAEQTKEVPLDPAAPRERC